MSLVSESLYSFERGKSPNKSLGVGRKQLIEKWLYEYEMEVYDYRINNDFTIDVEGNVWLNSKNLIEFPAYIQFNKITGSFHCGYNNLKSLRGCPKKVDKHFSCSENYLTSLEGCPTFVGGEFLCNNQKSGHKFVEDEVNQRCKVGGNIYV